MGNGYRGNGEGGKIGFDCIHWKTLYFTLAVRALKDWIVWVEWILRGLHEM